MASEGPIGAIVLAAGASSRMLGRNKALLLIDGRPMIARVVETFAKVADPIVVVTGHDPQSIQAALTDHPRIEFEHNPNHATSGMLSSIKVGVAGMRSRVDAFFLALGDQPFVSVATLQHLIELWRTSQSDIVRPTYRGKHGHPILIASRCIDSILALRDDQTLNDFVRANSTNAVDVPVEDAATIQDIDTPADYDAAIKRRQ